MKYNVVNDRWGMSVEATYAEILEQAAFFKVPIMRAICNGKNVVLERPSGEIIAEEVTA